MKGISDVARALYAICCPFAFGEAHLFTIPCPPADPRQPVPLTPCGPGATSRPRFFEAWMCVWLLLPWAPLCRRNCPSKLQSPTARRSTTAVSVNRPLAAWLEPLSLYVLNDVPPHSTHIQTCAMNRSLLGPSLQLWRRTLNYPYSWLDHQPPVPTQYAFRTDRFILEQHCTPLDGRMRALSGPPAHKNSCIITE